MDRDILAYLEVIEAFPFVKEVSVVTKQDRLYARIITQKSEKYAFEIEIVRSNLTIASSMHVIRKHKKHAPIILFAPYIGQTMGERLAKSNILYVDKHGNCWIKIEDDYYIHIQGKRENKNAGKHSLPSLRYAGYAGLFTLLTRPELVKQPIRTIAKEASVSRQAVVTLLQRLVNAHIIVEDKKSKYKWVLHNKKIALEWWLHGYREYVRPRLYMGSFAPQEKDLEAFLYQSNKLLNEFTAEWYISGSYAAYKQTKYYRGNELVLHMPACNIVMQKKLKLQKHNEGELTVLAPLPRGYQEPLEQHIAQPLLVYSEMLMSFDERILEAAELYKEAYLNDLQ